MGGGGVQRILKFIKYWDYSEYDVSVLTVKSSYFYAEDKTLVKEIPAQVSVCRSGSLDPFRIAQIIRKYFPARKRKSENLSQESAGFFRKIASLIFIPDSRILWLPFALYRISRINRQTPLDLIIATMPPFTSGLIAKWAFKLFGIPYFLDFRDAWTNNPYLPELTLAHSNIQKRLEWWVLKKARGTIFVNPRLQSYYLSAYPFLKDKPNQLIRNGFDPDDFTGIEQTKSSGSSGILKIGIMGTIYSQGNAPNTLIETISEILQENRQLSEKIKIYFVGKWTTTFKAWVSGLNLEPNINWIGYLEHRRALEFISQMDFLTLAIQSDIPGSENVTPGRIYEYLYLKCPILALCPLNSDLAGLIIDTQSGLVFDYYNKEKLKATILEWFENPAELISQFKFKNLKEFDRRVLAEELISFISKRVTSD